VLEVDDLFVLDQDGTVVKRHPHLLACRCRRSDDQTGLMDMPGQFMQAVILPFQIVVAQKHVPRRIAEKGQFRCDHQRGALVDRRMITLEDFIRIAFEITHLEIELKNADFHLSFHQS
jgi:hypothetical protein